MFGRGKSSTPKPSTSKSPSEPFNAKQFLLNHCEKIVLALFVGVTAWLVYDGFNAATLEAAKTPEDLATRANRARKEITDDNHWTVLQNEPGRLVKAKFAAKSETSREPTLAEPYSIGRLDGKDLQKGGKRGDPVVVAPVQIQVESFFGTIAVFSNRPASVDELPDAPPVTEDKRRGRGRPAAASSVERVLDAKYDKGYQKSIAVETLKGRKSKPKDAKVVPKIVGFNAVTAVINHEELVSSFRQEFESAAGYQTNRDSPNYLGYQVQRADVTDLNGQEVAEGQWQDASECNTNGQLKMLDLWAGEAKEVSVETYLEKDVLTMPIPPVLLVDYRPLATHYMIPKLDEVASSSGGYGGLSSDYSMPSSPNTGPSSGAPSGLMMGSGPSMGSGPPGGSQTGRSRGPVVANVMTAEETALVLASNPKVTTFSTYKLIRFYDFGVKPNRIYQYRVRIVLEDPNFPRLESFKVNASTMKPETVARVQQLEDAYRAELLKMGPNKKLLIRKSELTSKWSEPSSQVSLRIPTELFASRVEGTWNRMPVVGGQAKDLSIVESLMAKATLVYAEWDTNLAVLVPKSFIADRGTVLSGLSSGSDGGLDVIHPVTKAIKQLTGFAFEDPVTIADLRGGQPLAAEKRKDNREKDPLPAGGEVIAYDPRTGDLVISLEFSDLEKYRMHSFADEVEAAEKAK